MEDRTEFKCDICKKKYSSYKSRWLHIKKYHNDNSTLTKESKGKLMIKCDKCSFKCSTLEKLKEHNNTECRPSINSNNIYTFKANTLGKNKYKGINGGDIYIIQTEFNLKGYYKIGISTDLYKRLQNYRCGSVLEPKLHYYYPCKNIKDADKILKDKLKKFNIKREIYKTENLNEIRNIIKLIQKEMLSEDMEIEPDIKECEILPCEFCELHFTNNIDLDIHLNDKHKFQLISEGKTKEKIFECRYCFKTYKHKQTRYSHEKICKTVENEDNKDIKIKKLEKQNEEIKKQLEELKELIKNL
jgi:hypothetical protein